MVEIEDKDIAPPPDMGLAIPPEYVQGLARLGDGFVMDVHWGPAQILLLAVALLAVWRRVDILYIVGFAALYSLVAL